MDRIDRQIVHCLQRDGRASFRRIGEVLGVSEQTAARRYRALCADGALRVLVVPDTRAAGEQTWFARIRCRPTAADGLAEVIAARDDVSWVSITSGGGEIICLIRSSGDAAAPGSVLLDRLPRTNQVLSFVAHQVLRIHVGGEAEWLAFDDPLSEEQVAILLGDTDPSTRPPASPTAGLQDEDLPLLAALVRDGRAGVASLARATGWPQSRVRARVEALFASGAARVEVDLALPQFGFEAVAYVWLSVGPGELEATGGALSRHRETSFAAAITGTANLVTAVNCRDSAALYAYVTTKVGALPAIRHAEVVPVLRRVKQAGTRMRHGRLT